MRQHFVNGLFVRDQPPALARGEAPARDVILYLHGLGESGLCFEGLMADRRLGAWHQLALDLPGYGKSPWPDQPLDFAATVERLASWLAAAELPPVALVGHSMGGVLGADLARLVPARVRGFCNIEGNVSIEDCTFSLDVAAYRPEEFLASGRAELLDGIYRGGLDEEPLRSYYASLRLADPRQLQRDSVELVARSRAETLAEETAAAPPPVLYVLGDPRGTGARSRALLDAAGVRWHAVENAGHWAYLDQPDAFVDVLVAFLATVLAADPADGTP